MLSDHELHDLADTVVRNVDALEHSEYYGTDAANAAVNLIRLIESVAERQLAQTPNQADSTALLDSFTCGCHRTPTFHVSMTAPSGVTGVTIDMCVQCVLKLLDSPAVQANGRTVHLKRI